MIFDRRRLYGPSYDSGILMVALWTTRIQMGLLFLVLIGISFTGCLEDSDDDDIVWDVVKAAAELSAQNLKGTLSADTLAVQTDVQSLAGAEELLEVLNHPNATNNQSANEHLEIFNTAKGTAVCYLMNETGITVASSNWNATSSFVGKDYSFRPYFTEAMQDQAAEYFAVGVTTGVRGYYASYPVKDNGTVIGVVIIKMELDYFEASLSAQTYAFVVSPEGVIFLSSNQGLTLKTLWPIGDEVETELTSSKQFGTGPFSSMLSKEVANGDVIEYQDQKYLVTILAMDSEGWKLVILSPPPV